jgi:hypothetical protein
MKQNNNRKIALISIAVLLVIIIGVAVIASVAAFALPSVSKNKDLSALLSETFGTVEVQNSAQNPFNLVNDGFLLKPAMQLQTKEESRVRLDLSTGSIVRLGQMTIFSLDPKNAASGGVLSRLELQIGKVWIILKGGSLDVNTPAGLASVRGSYMSVEYDPTTHTITVECLEGHCSFQNAAGIVELTSGQKVVSSDPNTLPVVQPMDQADVQSWLANSPEAAAIIPQVATFIASSTPSITPDLTNGAAAGTPVDTLTPDLTNPALSETPTSTLALSLTPSLTQTLTLTPTLFGLFTGTPSLTPTVTPTATPTPTLGLSPTLTRTPTATRLLPPTVAPTTPGRPTSTRPPGSTPGPTKPPYP